MCRVTTGSTPTYSVRFPEFDEIVAKSYAPEAEPSHRAVRYGYEQLVHSITGLKLRRIFSTGSPCGSSPAAPRLSRYGADLHLCTLKVPVCACFSLVLDSLVALYITN